MKLKTCLMLLGALLLVLPTAHANHTTGTTNLSCVASNYYGNSCDCIPPIGTAVSNCYTGLVTRNNPISLGTVCVVGSPTSGTVSCDSNVVIYRRDTIVFNVSRHAEHFGGSCLCTFGSTIYWTPNQVGTYTAVISIQVTGFGLGVNGKFQASITVKPH